MPTDRRVMSAEEFASYVVGKASDVTKVGEVTRFVETVLKLQNDRSRPVYVFEVKPGVTEDDVAFINGIMNTLGVACVLAPSGLLTYVGEVTAESYGVRRVDPPIVRV